LYQSSQDHAVHGKAQEVRLLEKRLEKAIADLNRGTCENEQLREGIDELRKERQVLDTVFKQLDGGIKDKGKFIGRVKQTINEDQLSLEEAKRKHRATTKMLERERTVFKNNCDRLKDEVQKEHEVQKEQEKLSRASDGKDSTGKGRNKRSYMVADEEEAFSETVMHRRILKLSFLNTIQRRHIQQHQKNIEVFEQAFATIKSSTGIHEIDEIVNIFVALEQRNFSLLTYVNQLNREIEAIEIRNKELEAQLKQYNKDEKDSTAANNTAMKDVVQQTDKTKTATKDKDKMISDSASALEDVRPVIWETVKFLKNEIPILLNKGYEGDVPPLKVAPPDEHEESINQFLMYIEESLLQFKMCLSQDALRKHELPQSKASSSAGTGVKRPNELPNAHITGDDSDDDPETGLDKVLGRAELRERAQAMIQRRRKKPGAAGKATHETRGGPDAAAEEGAAGAAPAGGTAPPPPREYAASSASKESKDDIAASGGASLSKSPSMPAADGNEAGGYRDQMDWRKDKGRK